MEDFWNIIRAVFAAAGGYLGYFIGGGDGMFYALLILMVCDYITGVFCAIADRKLSSEVGFKGLAKKMLIFIMVGVANAVDVHILGEPGVVRTAVIFFYISNEGLSLMENSAHLGLPVPDSLKAVLEQLHRRDEKEGIQHTDAGGGSAGTETEDNKGGGAK